MKSTHISWLLTNLYLFVLDAYVSPFGAPLACSNTWRCSSEPPACCIAGVDLGLSSARCQTAGFVAQGLPSRCTSSSIPAAAAARPPPHRLDAFASLAVRVIAEAREQPIAMLQCNPPAGYSKPELCRKRQHSLHTPPIPTREKASHARVSALTWRKTKDGISTLTRPPLTARTLA